MQRIKWELEDLSLKYLDPIGYEEITQSLEKKQREHESFMERVQAQIESFINSTYNIRQRSARELKLFTPQPHLFAKTHPISSVYDRLRQDLTAFYRRNLYLSIQFNKNLVILFLT